MSELSDLRNLDEYEAAARESLPPAVFDYYVGGAEDETTVRGNRAAFGRWGLRPRRLVDVRDIDTSIDLLGSRPSMPLLLAPTAFQRLAHPDGEAATARAAAAADTIMVASTMATRSIEEIADAAGGPLWLQLYVFRDREISRALVERAEAAGCQAICLTIDMPVAGNRERDARNRFSLPADLTIANFVGNHRGRFPDTEGSGLEAFIQRQFDVSLTWEAVDWLASITTLPVVVKGVLRGDDAARAVDHGASAVIVSNHGGRQLDGAVPTLHALPEVAAEVGERVPVLMDGGVRRGTDVIRAVALGATAVLVGRPYLWGLAVGGEPGVRAVLELLRSELRRSMRLCGCRSVSEITPDLVVPIAG